MAFPKSPVLQYVSSESSTQTEPHSRTDSLCLVRPGKRFHPTLAASKLHLLKPMQPEGDTALSFDTAPSTSGILRPQLLPVSTESSQVIQASRGHQKQVRSHDFRSPSSTISSTPLHGVELSLKDTGSCAAEHQTRKSSLGDSLEQLRQDVENALHNCSEESLEFSGIDRFSEGSSDDSLCLRL